MESALAQGIHGMSEAVSRTAAAANTPSRGLEHAADVFLPYVDQF
jgi:hypothetical protein